MAFIRRDEEQDDTTAPTTGGGEGSVIAPGGQSGATNAAPTAPVAKPGSTGSGMFDNVGRYLDVNQDKATNLANRVGGVLGNAITGANKAVDSAAQNFNKAVDSSTVRADQGLITSAVQNAEQTAADKAKAAAVRSQYNANYAGPTDLTGQDYYNTAASAVGKAKSTAELANTEAGRKELLARANPGRASGGVASLNNAILQNSDDARNIIANAAKGASGLDKRLEDAAKAAGVYAQQGKAATDATRAAAQKAFADAYGTFESNAAGKATAAQKNAQSAATNALNAFNSGAKLTPAQLSILGIGQAEADTFRKGVSDYQAAVDAAAARDAEFKADRNLFSNLGTLTDDKGAYGAIGTGEGLFNASNTASAQDYARLAALNALSGRGDSFLSDPSLAGKAPGDLLDFRYGDLSKRLQDAIAAANAVQAKAQAEQGAKQDIQYEIPDAVQAMSNAPIKTGNEFLDTILNGAVGATQGVGGAISDLSKNTQKTIEKAAVDTKEEAKRFAENTKKAATQYVDKAKTLVNNPAKTTVATAKKAGGDIAASLKTATKDTKEEVAKAADKAKKGAVNPLAAVSNVINSFGGGDSWKSNPDAVKMLAQIAASAAAGSKAAPKTDSRSKVAKQRN